MFAADRGGLALENQPTRSVLHVRIVTGTGGGPDKTILNSPRWLIPFGYKVLCAYLHPPNDPGFDELRHRACRLDAPLVEIEDRGPLDLRAVRKLLALCREHHVDIWHGHDYKSDAIGLVLRRFWPMKLISTAHGFGVQVGRTPLYNRIDLGCLRWYDRVICVSDSLWETCTVGGVPASICTVIENAIDTEQYVRRMSPAAAKSGLGLRSDRLLIGAAGRFSAEKDFGGLLHAFGELSSDTDAELVLLGDGDQRAELDSLAKNLGVTDRVHLPGFQADLLPYYQAMDAFVLNSLREGLPNVLLEAMAMEVPIVATRVGGVPQVISPGDNGLLVEPGDTDGLRQSLKRLLVEADLRGRLAHAARRTIEQKYSFAARMQKVRAVYEQVLSGIRPQRSDQDDLDNRTSPTTPGRQVGCGQRRLSIQATKR
jgi:glycosyltransferase involved in cell wall biosynthesis